MTLKRENSFIIIAALLLLSLWSLWLLSPILTPFLLAAILAYICNPLVGWLQVRRVPRSVGALLTLLLLIGAIAGLLLVLTPLAEHEARLFVERLPGAIDRFKEHVVPLAASYGVDVTIGMDQIRSFAASHAQNAGGLLMKLLPSIKSSGVALMGFVANLLLVPVVLFYLLRDWDGLTARIAALIPRRWQEKTNTIAAEVDRVLSEFLRGQISVMLLMSAYYIAALHVAGLQFALPIGLVTGLLVFIPYLGMALGLSLALLAGAMQFSEVQGLAPVLVAFGIGQALEGMLVTPWLVGERIGLHPVAVIFALLAFGQLFGFFGVLLALPASAALLVGIRHLKNHYLNSDFYHQ
jgi:predicted PurR-regulated permease PerM